LDCGAADALLEVVVRSVEFSLVGAQNSDVTVEQGRSSPILSA
jgi:hypothetical protein